VHAEPAPDARGGIPATIAPLTTCACPDVLPSDSAKSLQTVPQKRRARQDNAHGAGDGTAVSGACKNSASPQRWQFPACARKPQMWPQHST